MSIQKRSAERKALFNKIFKDMKYCPICRGELQILGSRLGSAMKICEEKHGVMYVVGHRREKVGMFLEIFDEE